MLRGTFFTSVPKKGVSPFRGVAVGSTIEVPQSFNKYFNSADFAWAANQQIIEVQSELTGGKHYATVLKLHETPNWIKNFEKKIAAIDTSATYSQTGRVQVKLEAERVYCEFYTNSNLENIAKILHKNYVTKLRPCLQIDRLEDSFRYLSLPHLELISCLPSDEYVNNVVLMHHLEIVELTKAKVPNLLSIYGYHTNYLRVFKKDV